MASFTSSPNRPLRHLVLLGLTAVSVFVTFPLTFGSGGEVLVESVQFTVALLVILGAHEMGHYVLARRHGVETSLPYFIPLPLLGVGTLGAVIRIRGRIPDRNALVDIGASGPFAGLVVAVSFLAVGLLHSQVVDVPVAPHRFPPAESLWALVARLVEYLQARSGGWRPDLELGASGSGLELGDNLLLLLLQRVLVGSLPDGKVVMAHPYVVAGWFGLLVTMLNLVPMGQLDGGHVAYALVGERARTVGRGAALVLALLAVFASASWCLWLVVTAKLLGFGHPEVVDGARPLTTGRKWVCLAVFAAFVLCLMPIPVSVLGGP